MKPLKLNCARMPFRKIERELGLHRQQIKRAIQKGLKWFLENYEESKGGLGEKNVNVSETAPLQERPPK